MVYQTKMLIFMIFLLLSMILQISESNLYEKRNQRSQARTLIYPPTAPTRVQFIGGIGIPVEDLFHESVTSGYVLKAEYFLPERADEFTTHYLRPQSIDRRSAPQIIMNETLASRKVSSRVGSYSLDSNFKSQQSYASTYRWVVYKAIEVALSSSGLPGKVCVLRSICEHAAAPIHYGNGLLAELLHIILTPSTSQDKFSNTTDKSYLKAEHFGRVGKNCKKEFRDCQKSPIDLITTVFDIDYFIY